MMRGEERARNSLRQLMVELSLCALLLLSPLANLQQVLSRLAVVRVPAQHPLELGGGLRPFAQPAVRLTQPKHGLGTLGIDR